MEKGVEIKEIEQCDFITPSLNDFDFPSSHLIVLVEFCHLPPPKSDMSTCQHCK